MRYGGGSHLLPPCGPRLNSIRPRNTDLYSFSFSSSPVSFRFPVPFRFFRQIGRHLLDKSVYRVVPSFSFFYRVFFTEFSGLGSPAVVRRQPFEVLFF